MKEHHYWGGVSPMPIFPGGSFHSPSADFGFNMPLELGNTMVPVERWSDPISMWSPDAYDLPSDWIPSDQLYPCQANYSFPSAFTNDVLPGARQATQMAIPEPFQTKRLNYGENELPFGINDLPDPAWVNQPDLAIVAKLPPTTTSQAVLSMKNIHNSLLRLKLGLLEDLELFENRSILLQSSSLFYEDSNLSIETLDLPIYRLLEHSSWLLAIIRSSCGTTEDSLGVTPGAQPFKPESIGYDDSLPILPDAGDSGGDEGATSVSPHDSGYHTTMTSPDRTTSSTVPKCDVVLWLGILEAHCSLVRIYRAVFMRLYQLFLIIPPADAATILLLPEVRFGQFHLDGNLILQVKSLVEFSSTMMGKLDQALKMRSGLAQPQEGREFDPTETFRQENWSTSIREIVLTQEQDTCEMSLMEIMDYLRQLVKDTVVI
ncbi:unnamed protein product [Penicillium crustosum]